MKKLNYCFGFRYSVTIFLLSVLLISCGRNATKDKSSNDAVDKITAAKRFLLIEPNVKMYELSVGGVNTEMEEWSITASQNASNAIKKQLEDMDKEVITIKADSFKTEIGEMLAIYGTVQNSIMTHGRFPNKIKSFVYWAGDTKALIDKFNVDYVFVTYGISQVSSSGRLAAQTGMAAIGLIFGVISVPQTGISTLNMAALDEKGMISWFGYNPTGGRDFRDYSSMNYTVIDMFKTFPTNKKEKK